MRATTYRFPHLVTVTAVVGLVCGLRFAMGCSAFPVIDGDGVFFWPSALAWARGKGLTNTFLPEAIQFDPAGEGRLVHGFLHQVILGSLVWEATPMALHVVESLLQIVTLFLGTWCFLRVAARTASTAWRGVALASAAVLAVSSPLLGLTGRPETLAMLFVSAGIVVLLVAPAGQASWIVAGVLLGLTAVTDPGVALLVASALAVHASIRWPGRLATFRLAEAYATGAVVGLSLALVVYPYGLPFWIVGLQRHASLTTGFSESGLGGIPLYWLGDVRAPFLILTLGWALWMVIGVAFREAASSGPDRRAPLAVLALAGIVGVYAVGRRPEQVYYIMSLMPLWCALIINGPPDRGIEGRRGANTRREIVGMVVMFLTGSGFLLGAVQFHGYWTQGVSLNEARRAFALLRHARPESTAVTGAFWALDDDPPSLHLYRGQASSGSGTSTVVVLQQANTGRLEPPELPGFEIVEDRFVRAQPRFLGLPYGRTVKSYAFSVYRSQHGSHARSAGDPREAESCARRAACRRG